MKQMILFFSLFLLSNVSWSTCISGNCTDGYGTYTWKNGNKYIGQFRNGDFSGQGSHTWPDGKEYIGQFRNDTFNGQGTLTTPSGTKYEGQWKDDKKNGQGTSTWSDGRKYVGQWKDDEKNGLGTYTWSDGQKYVGQFKKGLRDGKGSHNRVDGSKYVGQFKDGSPIPGLGIDYLYDGRQILYFKSKTDLRNVNGDLILSDISDDDIATVRSESANNKRHADKRLARKIQAKERQDNLTQRLNNKKIMGIQQQLINHLYLSGSADGIAGKATHNALRAFYKDADLKSPALDAFDIISDDLRLNLIESKGGCIADSKMSSFTACFNLN